MQLCAQLCREAQLQEHTQKSPDDCLSAEKISVPQKSSSNSYSSIVFSLSGSGASLGIDCQAYCLNHLRAVQGENTSTLGETRALRFSFNLTEIEAKFKLTAPPPDTPLPPFSTPSKLVFCLFHLFIYSFTVFFCCLTYSFILRV